jgi:hypothetical protein
MTKLTLQSAHAFRPSGEWRDDEYDVLADGKLVGRIFHSAASPVGRPWMWTVIFDRDKAISPTHGFEPTRDAAMETFAKIWRRRTSKA